MTDSEVVKLLKKKKPQVYKELAKKLRPTPPKKELQELTREAKYLVKGETVTVPVKRKAMLVKTILFWEPDECLIFTGDIDPQPNPTPSKASEKLLIKLLDRALNDAYNDVLLEEFHKEILNSIPAKKFEKRANAFQQTLNRFSQKYDFDYETDINIYP
mgnify:CR=1 FL=1